MHNSHMKKVLALLDAENAIIRRGDLRSLDNIAEQKELLMRDLENLKVAQSDLVAVRDAATRNARLLAAALAGVKEARARLGALAEVREGLSIYDQKGGRQTVARQSNALERKA